MTFDLKVGYTCNNNCLHCVVSDKRKCNDISLPQIKRIIESQQNIQHVVVTGGEATIRTDFIDILKFLKSRGFDITLQTNGRAFQDGDFAKEAAQYLSMALVALHSHNSAMHDMITQRPGSWRETIAGIHYLIGAQAQCEVRTQTVISKLNCNGLAKTFNFIQDRFGPLRMYLTFPHPNGNAYLYYDQVVPSYRSIEPQIKLILQKHVDKIAVEAIPLCYLHPYRPSMSEDEVLKQQEKSGFDVANKNSTFFNDQGIIGDYCKAIISERQKLPQCKQCIYNSKCIGVWKEYLEKHNDLRPVK